MTLEVNSECQFSLKIKYKKTFVFEKLKYKKTIVLKKFFTRATNTGRGVFRTMSNIWNGAPSWILEKVFNKPLIGLPFLLIYWWTDIYIFSNKPYGIPAHIFPSTRTLWIPWKLKKIYHYICLTKRMRKETRWFISYMALCNLNWYAFYTF